MKRSDLLTEDERRQLDKAFPGWEQRMADPTQDQLRNAPLLGSPGKKLLWYPTLVMQCLCPRTDGGITMLIITGVGNMVSCPRCGKLYKVAGFTVDPLTNLMEPVLECLLPGPSTAM